VQLTYGRIDLCTYQRREKHPMYTLITAKSLWTIICIGEITVLFVWLLEYGKDLLHVQYGRLFHFSIVIYIHLNSPDENWKKVFLSMVCPLKMHRVSPVFVPLYTTCSIHFWAFSGWGSLLEPKRKFLKFPRFLTWKCSKMTKTWAHPSTNHHRWIPKFRNYPLVN